MSTAEPDSEVLFFFGAGASVGAGVPATIGMVEGFRKKISSYPENLRALDRILETLEQWKYEQGKETSVDVELLLETIERLENKDKDILLKFFEINGYLLADYANKKPLKDQLKDYIKEMGIVNSQSIAYLEPLLVFMADYRPLNIFSANYDICVEQFCNTYKKEYTDGFAIKWNPKLFERKATDIALYKLHGSITWYRTDRGDYVMLPIMSHNAKTTLITGERAETLILYPMRKWEYAEPLLELLLELKKKLEQAKFVFVIGYSFRDDHIRNIFWDAARKNKDLVMFLISPDSFEIYQNRLKDYALHEIQNSFSSEFECGTFDAPVPSGLKNRVIQLPYKFEKVFPLLKNTYLKELIAGLSQEKGCKDQENQGVIDPPWRSCLQQFIACEYVDKIKNVLEKDAWGKYLDDYERRQPPYGITMAFTAFLTASLSNDKSYENFWTMSLNNELSKIFDVNRLRFDVSKELVRPVFDCTEEPHYNLDRILNLINFMQKQCVLKISLVSDEKKAIFAEVKSKLDCVQKYFHQFKGGQNDRLSLNEYLQIRREKYPDLNKKICLPDRLNADVLLDVEKKEITIAFSGSSLFFGNR